MARKTVVVLCLVIGAGLIVAGVAWKQFFPPESYWSEEQAGEYVEASRALKMAAMREGRRAGDPPDPQLVEAQARFDEVKSDLDRAIAARDHTGTVVAIAGGALVVVAIWLLQSIRQSD